MPRMGEWWQLNKKRGVVREGFTVKMTLEPRPVDVQDLTMSSETPMVGGIIPILQMRTGRLLEAK